LRVPSVTSAEATRIENRAGEPAANPYLYLASQAASGMAGMAGRRDPPAAVDAPYQTESVRLPATLEAALGALDASAELRKALGDSFVDYFLMIKRAEITRFNEAVTDWEHREYFDLF